MQCPRIDKLESGQFRITGTNRENQPFLAIKDNKADALSFAANVARINRIAYIVDNNKIKLLKRGM